MSFADIANEAVRLVDIVYQNELLKLAKPIPWEYLAYESSGVMTDVVTPNFKKRSAAGEIINSPMTKLSYKFFCTPNFTQDTNKPESVNAVTHFNVKSVNVTSAGKSVYFETLYVPIDPRLHNADVPTAKLTAIARNTYFPDVRSIALGKARDKLQKADFDMLVEAVEMPKTLQYLTTVILRVLKMMRLLKKGEWRKIAPKAWKKLKRDPTLLFTLMAEAWLEVRFAIRPLVFTIEGIVKYLAKETPTDDRVTVRGHNSQENSGDHVYTDIFGYRYEFSCRHTQDARSGILSRVLFASKVEDFGLLNFTRTAWEVVPFSWLSDYFISISNLLYYVTPNVGVEELADWVTFNETVNITGVKYLDDVKICDFTIVDTHIKRDPNHFGALFTLSGDNPLLDMSKLSDIISLAVVLKQGKSQKLIAR